jgi:hypothetical protein
MWALYFLEYVSSMIDAIEYRDIVKSVTDDFNASPKKLYFTDSVDPAQRKLMVEINSKIKKHALVAVLFCNPKTEFCQSEILHSLNYFHHRSKKHINIFCCGYGAYWSQEKYPDLEGVTTIDGVKWSYSDSAFVSLVEEFETKTKWRYSGENELLILDVSHSEKPADLDIGNAIICNLEKMNRDGAFDSVRAFFEDIIRYASSNDAVDTWGLSDREGVKAAKGLLKNAILDLLPSNLKKTYSQAENYAIRQI